MHEARGAPGPESTPGFGPGIRQIPENRTVSPRQYAPMKSFLPISTPLWRSRSYAVVTWKKNCGKP